MFPSSGAARAADTPLHADRSREIAGRLDDPRLDLHLGLRGVEGGENRERRIDGGLQVGDDERIGPRVDLQGAASRQHALGDEPRDLFGLRVIEARVTMCTSPESPCSSASFLRRFSSSARTTSGATRTIGPSTT